MRSEKIDRKLQYMDDLFGASLPMYDSLFVNGRSVGGPAGDDLDYNTLIQISPHEAGILQLLIRMNKIKSVVEIGTLAGYSAACMAQVLPSDGVLYTIEHNPKHVAIAADNFIKLQLTDKIQLLYGQALQQLLLLETKAPFDMIFIDADKSGYPNYLAWAERHVKQGGLIVADNTFLFDSVFLDSPPENVSQNSWCAMRDFNARLANKELYCSTLIPTVEGLTVAIKLFS